MTPSAEKKTSILTKLTSPIYIRYFLFYARRHFFEQMELARVDRGQDSAMRKSKNQCFIDAAKRLSIECIEYENHVLEFRNQGKKMFVHGYDTEADNYPVQALTSDKYIAGKVMRANGVPTPQAGSFTLASYTQAVEYFKSLEVAVVKPRHGWCGDGVTVAVKTVKEFSAAFLEASVYDADVVVEKFIPGENVRLLVHDGKVVAAEFRLSARVVGDGKSSISKLIQTINFERTNGANTAKLRPIIINADLHTYLHSQGLTLNSIPEANVTVRVRGACNYNQGGSIEDASTFIHPGYLALAIKAATVFNAKLAGVDVITTDLRKSPMEGQAHINEINLRRDITIDMVTNRQSTVEPAEAILRSYFNISSATGRINVQSAA